MDPGLVPIFTMAALASTLGIVPLTRFMERKGLTQIIKLSRAFHLIQINLAGMVLAALFLFTYLVLAQSLNFPEYLTVDQFFETDISSWLSRFTLHPQDAMPSIRSVHPAVMLVLRPPHWLLGVLLNGDKLQAVYLLSALAGALSVFLIWSIVKRENGNTAHALIFASIMGASASHILLSTMSETYIFSALALISFCLLMQTDRTSLRYTIPAGMVIFGITVTNLAQACILYFLKLPRLKVMIGFVAAVIMGVFAFNLLQVRLFPSAWPFFDPSSLLVENHYRFDPFTAEDWRLKGRVKLISRAVLLYGIIAPTPFVLTEELGTSIPTFRTYRIDIKQFHVAGYRGVADIAAKAWILLLTFSIFLFLIGLVRFPKQMAFPGSLLLCVGFSICLHIFYGDDPMLYSPNWVYALVLVTATLSAKWADKRWLHLLLILFLGMMIYVNLGLVQQILFVSQPYYGK
jgi:hypothetical protein